MTYTLCTKYRIATLTITEEPERIIVAMSFSKYGRLGDENEIKQWHAKYLQPYNSDPRPFQLTNPHSGEVATVWGDADNCLAVIATRSDLH